MNVHRAGKGRLSRLPLFFGHLQHIYLHRQTIYGIRHAVLIFLYTRGKVRVRAYRLTDRFLQARYIDVFRQRKQHRILVIDLFVNGCLTGVIHAQLALT